MASNVQDAASDLADKAGRAFTDTATDAASVTGDQARAWADDLTGLIHRHPMQALLLGFGAGMLAAFLLGRRSGA